MAFTKYFIAALAVAATAMAQTNTICDGPTTTIQNQGDAQALSGCSTVTGDVVIASNAAGTIAIDGIQKITGSLSSVGAVNLTSLSGDSLTTIGRVFGLNGLTILSNLGFPQLAAVDTIDWQALPGLQQLSFTTGVTMASNVTISNTQLNSLDGINLATVDIFDINNNPYLNQINVQTGNVTQALNIAANGRNLQVSFPNLDWAFNMTFRNCSSVSTPSLASVNGSLGFYSNYFSNYAAPNLTSTGGSLVFDDNPSLTNISLPALKQIGGGYQIANNTDLITIDGFKNLQVVAGALDFSGTFQNVSLPALSDVRGGFNMQTTSTFSCSAFDSDHSNQVIKGTYVCAGKQQKPGTAGSTPTGSSSSSSASSTTSSSSKKSAAGRFEVNIPAIMGVVSLIAGLLHIVL